MTNGDGDFFGAASKTAIFLLFILLFSKRLAWAKWILSVLLILYGLLCLLVGFELMAVFYFVGMYDIFFGIYIHKSKALGVYRNDNIETDDISQTTETIGKQTIVINQEHLYPRLVKRYKALLIDGLLIVFTLIVIMVVVQDSDIRTPIMVSSALIISLTYEPFLTSYSRTVGQRLMRIKVGRYQEPEKRITLLNAYIRWCVKGLLGWISFITIHFNPERRAIHDLASGAVMINEEGDHSNP
jgi:uncharacterized RDD family membrane protein YckC